MCSVNHTVQPLVRCATRAGQAQRITSQSRALTLVKTETVFTHIHGQRSYLDGFGLHYYVARWYDPTTAHFAQADTIIPNPGNSGDWDRYAYVLNNPMKYIDFSGHSYSGDDYYDDGAYYGNQMAYELAGFSYENTPLDWIKEQTGVEITFYDVFFEVSFILDMIEKYAADWMALHDFSWDNESLGYFFASIQTESFMGAIMTEMGTRDELDARYGNAPFREALGANYEYIGHGYIMLTLQSNYQQMSDNWGIDFDSNPELVSSDPEWSMRIAMRFMILGMGNGVDGRGLGDYDYTSQTDMLNARNMLNPGASSQERQNVANLAVSFTEIFSRYSYCSSLTP